ncbi:hypothetical protein ACHMW9_14645 [Mesorhizobium terrae]
MFLDWLFLARLLLRFGGRSFGLRLLPRDGLSLFLDRLLLVRFLFRRLFRWRRRFGLGFYLRCRRSLCHRFGQGDGLGHRNRFGRRLRLRGGLFGRRRAAVGRLAAAFGLGKDQRQGGHRTESGVILQWQGGKRR